MKIKKILTNERLWDKEWEKSLPLVDSLPSRQLDALSDASPSSPCCYSGGRPSLVVDEFPWEAYPVDLVASGHASCFLVEVALSALLVPQRRRPQIL